MRKQPPTYRGKYPVLLGLTEDERELLMEAAQAEARPVTQFVLFHALTAAKKILKKTGKSA